MEGADVDELWLDGLGLAPEDLFNDFYESKDQLFVFSKDESASTVIPSPEADPPSSADNRTASD
jgi:hypothetical protein